ncbi:MAG: hypothetical protein QI197_02065 [Candidatus Korarchaeota archaeon]|nr:hypothetical protein [Candidatus Korarchaeota archaeon]
MKEEIVLRGGKATIICVDEKESGKFRILYRKDRWREDEWVRIDSEGGDSYLQVRRRLGKLKCEDLKQALEEILDKVEELGGFGSEEFGENED